MYCSDGSCPRRILVVGNYPLDQQQSMKRFAHLLLDFYKVHAKVNLIRPPVLITRIPNLPALASKYLAYIDKLLLFPFWLAVQSRFYNLVHIADHSNAFYAFCCPPKRCVVTCHDLLAMRGAMGDSTVACDPSPIGIWLQRLIKAGLRRAGSVVFVSHATFNDFQRLIGPLPDQRQAVIPTPLNAPFTADLGAVTLSAEEQRLIPLEPFLLMVGSTEPRKNRLLSLRLLLELGAASPYQLVFAGSPLVSSEMDFITEHQLSTKVHVIVRPSHALLNHLYGRAHALLFPSVAEGFGWPLIEAQACACPVIASTTTSIPEVAGDAALYAAPYDVTTFASHVHALEDSATRACLIHLGKLNLGRFDPEVQSRAYTTFALQPEQSQL